MKYFRVTILDKGKKKELDIKATNKNVAKEIAVAKIKGSKAILAKEVSEPIAERAIGIYKSVLNGMKRSMYLISYLYSNRCR